MSDLGYITWDDGSVRIMRQDLASMLTKNLHKASPLLGAALRVRVVDRTPTSTGALQEDASYTAYTNANSDTIVRLYFGEDNQLEAWKRVYWLYQEGGTLGLPTYTNEPHEMLARVGTDDIDVVEGWLEMVADGTLGSFAKGEGDTA
jgi:hypothetical protein